MADILLFILLGIIGREYFIVIPMLICFSIIYIVKSKFNKRKIFILIFFLVFSFSQCLLRFNNLLDNNKINDKGLITDVREYDDYNRITVMSGLKKFYTYDSNKEFQRGDLIQFEGILKKHERRTMPLIFDARNYYYSNGISYKIEKSNIKFISKTFLSKLENLRLKAGDIYNESLSSTAAAISKGITLRYREDVPLIQNITDIGLSHILSVSGLHLSIILSIIFFMISLTGMGIKLRYIISCIFMLLYSFIIGFTPSLVRALIMIFALMYKKIYIPNISNIDSLLFAASMSLIINPYYIYSVGFILSYLCMFGILVIYKKLNKFLYRKKGCKNIFYSALFLNISIQIATLPVVIYYFNKINIFSIIINIILVPIFSLYLIMSVLFLLIYKIKFLSFILSISLNNIADLFDTIVYFFNKSTFNIVLKSPPIIFIFIYYLLIFYVIKYYKIKYLKIDYKNFIFILILLSIPNPMHFKNFDRVEFLDVGQGDSALISIGNKNILIDSGGNPFSIGSVGKYIVEPYLIKTGRNKIDIAIITHFDYDHFGGFTEFSDNIKLKNVYSNHYISKDFDSVTFEKIKNLNYKILKEDANLKISNKYSIALVPGNSSFSDENNKSLVSVLRKNDTNLVYFSGDIEADAEKSILKNSPKTYILKVPHHGSKTSSSEDFIDIIQPKKAIISVGRYNKYGHPNKEVLNRYIDRNIDLYMTNRDGLITFDLNNFKIYKYNDNEYINWLIIYFQFIFSLIIVLYKEERWIIQYF